MKRSSDESDDFFSSFFQSPMPITSGRGCVVCSPKQLSFPTLNKKCLLNLSLSSFMVGLYKKIKSNQVYRMWTTHHILLDSGLWVNGKLHAQKFEARRYSREDNRVMFKLWSADNELNSVAFKQTPATQKYSYGCHTTVAKIGLVGIPSKGAYPRKNNATEAPEDVFICEQRLDIESILYERSWATCNFDYI